MKTTALIGILLLLALPATAGTLITATSVDGVSRQIMIEGDKARINEPDSGNYGLVDLQTGMLYSVDAGRKVVMEFNPDMMGSDDSPLPADVQLKAVGAGPEIAGYATEVYQLSAGGQLCATHYLSKDALKEKDLQRFVEAFTRFSSAGRMAAAPFMSPCAVAATHMTGDLARYGLSLKSETPGGGVEHLVTAIRTGATVDAQALTLPEDYQRVNLQSQMQNALQQMMQKKR